MKNKETKKKENIVTALSTGIVAALAVVLVILGVMHKVETIWFPAAAAVFLTIFWLVSDVLSVRWLDSFQGKTEEQKKAYYLYSLMNLVSLGGLVYFVADLHSMTGALIYVAGTVAKRKFLEDFKNSGEDAADSN